MTEWLIEFWREDPVLLSIIGVFVIALLVGVIGGAFIDSGGTSGI